MHACARQVMFKLRLIDSLCTALSVERPTQRIYVRCNTKKSERCPIQYKVRQHNWYIKCTSCCQLVCGSVRMYTFSILLRIACEN